MERKRWLLTLADLAGALDLPEGVTIADLVLGPCGDVTVLAVDLDGLDGRRLPPPGRLVAAPNQPAEAR